MQEKGKKNRSLHVSLGKKILYLFRNDTKHLFRRFLLPSFFSSLFSFLKKKSFYKRDKGLFLFNTENLESFYAKISDIEAPLIIALSYCQKPQSCPVERFSFQCHPLDSHNTCKECFFHSYKRISLPNTYFFIILTVHDFAEKIFELHKSFPYKKIYFAISCCEFATEIFTPFATLFPPFEGIIFPLQGPTCQSFQAFIHAEKGKKNAKTFLSTKIKIFLDLLIEKRSLAKNLVRK